MNDTFEQTALALERKGYPPGFFHWLSKNPSIYRAFKRKAILMAGRRKHYSARAILHAIRWETDLRERNATFKVNNNWTPGMARLFMSQHPEHAGFFRCRDSQGLDE